MESQRYEYPKALKYKVIALYAALGLSVNNCYKELFVRADAAKLGPQQTHQIKTADLNHNGIPERFYNIDGKIALIELDGKPVTELLKR